MPMVNLNFLIFVMNKVTKADKGLFSFGILFDLKLKVWFVMSIVVEPKKKGPKVWGPIN